MLSLFNKQQFVALYCLCLDFVNRRIADQLLLLEGDFLSQSGISEMQHNLQEVTEIFQISDMADPQVEGDTPEIQVCSFRWWQCLHHICMNIFKTPHREVHFDDQDGDSGDRHKSLTESDFKVPARQSHQIASTHDTVSKRHRTPQASSNLRLI
jgi:hypothetical protein